jgi:hypothetical protein
MGLRINLVDSFGLADPLGARAELGDRGRPGHEKALGTIWFAAKYVAKGVTQDPRVEVAKRALECGLLKELHHATHDPLTLSRFFRNVLVSYRLHQVRVPIDPNVAVERFCNTERSFVDAHTSVRAIGGAPLSQARPWAR